MLDLRLYVSRYSEIDDNGFLGLQFDAFGEDESGMPTVQVRHPYGFASRPLDPDLDGEGTVTFGCETFVAWEGSDSFAWLADDPRVTSELPPLSKGGSIQYDSGGSFTLFDPDTHTVTTYVPYADGKAHLVTVGNDTNGVPIIELAHGEGPAVTLLGEVLTVKNADGSAYLKVSAAGVEIVGPFKAGGADLGGAASQPLTLFAPLATALAAMQAALAATAAGLVPSNPAAAAAVSASAAALATLSATGPTLFTKGA